MGAPILSKNREIGKKSAGFGRQGRAKRSKSLQSFPNLAKLERIDRKLQFVSL